MQSSQSFQLFLQTGKQCPNLNIVETRTVVGSVNMGVATRCTFTAWQLTSVAMMLLDYTTVTGTPTTTHTDCGEHHTTSGNHVLHLEI